MRKCSKLTCPTSAESELKVLKQPLHLHCTKGPDWDCIVCSDGDGSPGLGEDMGLAGCGCVNGEGDGSKAGLGMSWGVEDAESSGGNVCVSRGCCTRGFELARKESMDESARKA